MGSVKFDVRYIVLLRSVKPLGLFAYDVFWLRFSNRPFELNDLDDYEKHFTVMNYDPDVVLKQMHYDEFIPKFEKQYPEFPWSSVQAKIFRAFTELFQVACAKPPPLGLCDYPSSRAVYAVDLMLKWDTRPDGSQAMQPQILEVNFNPDCERACRYHPSSSTTSSAPCSWTSLATATSPASSRPRGPATCAGEALPVPLRSFCRAPPRPSGTTVPTTVRALRTETCPCP